MSKITSIRLTQATKDKLEALGRKGESYEEIILQLMNGTIKGEKPCPKR